MVSSLAFAKNTAVLQSIWSGTRWVLGFVGQRKCQHCRTKIPLANNMQELKDATTYDTSLVLNSERVKQAILFLQLTKLENHRLHILPLKKSHIPDRMCQKCHLQYIGETQRQLNERFGEHWRSILNHQQLSTTTPVSLHLNQASHSINDVSRSSRLNSYTQQTWLSKKGSRGSFNKQSQNIISVWYKQKRWSTPASNPSDTYLLIAYQSLSRILI